MRLWKILLILAIVASGFGTGYLFRSRQPVVQSPVPEPETASHNPGYDPSLVLPAPSMRSESFEPPLGEIAGHFRAKASLASEKSTPPIEILGPDLPTVEPPILPVAIQAVGVKSEPIIELPPTPPIDPSPERLPPTVIRLPAPPEEPPVAPVHYPVPQGKVVPGSPRPIGARDPTVHPPTQAEQVPTPWVYSNIRDIQLNFDVTKKGSSGIKAVELWARRTPTSDYECVDRMEGNTPPFATRLWSEGNYEFRLVLISGTGVRSPIPNRNDAPDLHVCLDTTSPAVEMLPARSDSQQPGAILLRWNVVDEHIDENPIRLEYSIDGEQWSSITEDDAWMPNTGNYSWKVPEGLPNSLHLRVVARDKAGNVAYSQSSSVVPVDLTVPAGKISGFVETLPPPKVSSECENMPNTAGGALLGAGLGALIGRGYGQGALVGGAIGSERELLPMPIPVLGPSEWENAGTATYSYWGLNGASIIRPYYANTPPSPWDGISLTYCEWVGQNLSMSPREKSRHKTGVSLQTTSPNSEQLGTDCTAFFDPSRVELLWRFVCIPVCDNTPRLSGPPTFDRSEPAIQMPFPLPFSEELGDNPMFSQRHEAYFTLLNLRMPVTPRPYDPGPWPGARAIYVHPRVSAEPSAKQRELLPIPKEQTEFAQRVKRELLPMPTPIIDGPGSEVIIEPQTSNSSENGRMWYRLNLKPSWRDWIRSNVNLADTPKAQDFDPAAFVRLPESTEALLDYLCPSWNRSGREEPRPPDFNEGFKIFQSEAPYPFALPLSDKRKPGSLLSDRHSSYLEQIDLEGKQTNYYISPRGMPGIGYFF